MKFSIVIYLSVLLYDFLNMTQEKVEGQSQLFHRSKGLSFHPDGLLLHELLPLSEFLLIFMCFPIFQLASWLSSWHCL